MIANFSRIAVTLNNRANESDVTTDYDAANGRDRPRYFHLSRVSRDEYRLVSTNCLIAMWPKYILKSRPDRWRATTLSLTKRSLVRQS